jgi:hypothetical protein
LKVQQPGAATNPISVDSQLFRRLRPILGKVRVMGIRTVAETHELSTETVEWLATGGPGEAFGIGRAQPLAPDSVAHELQSIDDARLATIRADIRNHTSFTYVLSHRGQFTFWQLFLPLLTRSGKSFEPDDLEELISLLETEAGYPSSIKVETRSGSAFGLHLVLGGVSSGAIYTVSGDDDDCAVIANRIGNMLRASAPSFSWLHRSWLRRLGALVCALCVGAAGAAPLTRFAGGWWLAVLAGVAILAFVPLQWAMQQAFPICQFDFGPDKRKRATYIGVLGLALSTIVIPVAQAAWTG